MRIIIKLLIALSVVNVLAATNVSIQIRAAKNWRIERELIGFSLVVTNKGDTAVFVSTNEATLFLFQLYGENSEFSKSHLQTAFSDFMNDYHEGMGSLQESKTLITDMINEYYAPLYRTNGTRRLELYLGNGLWQNTEPFTNTVMIVTPTQTNLL